MIGTVQQFTKLLFNKGNEHETFTIDPINGFTEFPAFGDTKKHLLPIYIDKEENERRVYENLDDTVIRISILDTENTWMPDKSCKTCFCCEDPFNIYRRRHHCRICGQVFCNPCSQFYLEGSTYNLQNGLVRACQRCNEEISKSTAIEKKQFHLRTRQHSTNNNNNIILASERLMQLTGSLNDIIELSQDRLQHTNNLQQRSALHLESIVDSLVRTSTLIESENIAIWKSTILYLVREVVSHVDPNVKLGDSLDIRDYVKVKIIPGGSMDENAYIDGVVFRKNVAHKNMIKNSAKSNPRILLISEGIDFQKSDYKLSSLDTLIEQEDKYFCLMVEKIMYLKPDLLLVGKSVARSAQELLSKQNVVVIQNVKQNLLERIARMTGAMMLPSADQMIHQYGEDCLGTSGKFWLRQVEDDPERFCVQRDRRVILTQLLKGSTYAYIEGCRPELGCTLILRGSNRETLSEIKKFINFSIVVAYHLRLEVAYYNDRSAQIPSIPDLDLYDDNSDDEDLITNEGLDDNYKNYLKETRSKKEIKDINTDNDKVPVILTDLLSKKCRNLLSTSLDTDLSLPYKEEVIGRKHYFHMKALLNKKTAQEYHSLQVTSLLTADSSINSAQNWRPDVKNINFYCNGQDMGFGQFLHSCCFGMIMFPGKDLTNLLGHTYSFVHRTGRVDVNVQQIDIINQDRVLDDKDLENISIPIYIYSYCKVCQKVVTPKNILSDEVWKMSFGKYLEMTFYNRSAKCRTSNCSHNIRDDHQLCFYCEGYEAKFNFIPIHPFSIRVRSNLLYSSDFHYSHVTKLLNEIEAELVIFNHNFSKTLLKVDEISKEINLIDPEYVKQANAILTSSIAELNEETIVIKDGLNQTRILLTHELAEQVGNLALISTKETMTQEKKMIDLTDVKLLLDEHKSNDVIAITFPMVHKRALFIMSANWKLQIDDILKKYDKIKTDHLQAQAQLLRQLNKHGNHLDELIDNYNNKDAINDDENNNNNDDDDDDDKKDIVVINNKALSERMNFNQSIKDSMVDVSELNRDTFSPSIIDLDKEDDICDQLNKDDHNEISLQSPEKDKKNREFSTFLEEKNKNRFAKLKNLLGLESSGFDFKKNLLPLGRIGMGRLGLLQGRKGEVIAINDDEFSTIIAYSLASQDYYNQLFNKTPVSSKDVEESTSNVENIVDNIVKNVRSTIKSESKKEDINFDDLDDLAKREKLIENEEIRKKEREKEEEETDEILVQNNLFMTGISNNKGKIEEAVKPGIFSVFISTPLNIGSIKKENYTANHNNQNKIEDHHDIEDNDDEPDQNNFLFSNLNKQENNEINNVYNDNYDNINNKENINAKFNINKDSLNQNNKKGIKSRLLSQSKSNIMIRFDDKDPKNNVICKFMCHIYWASQFEALREVYLNEEENVGFIASLSLAKGWDSGGGKSGASFSKSLDDRFIVKAISDIEMKMFLDFAPSYFKHMSSAIIDKVPTVLCKILGIYSVGCHNKETGKKVRENIVVMENILYNRNITKIFDLKGKSKSRYVELKQENGNPVQDFDEIVLSRRKARRHKTKLPEKNNKYKQVLLDENLMQLTRGRPFPLKNRAKKYFSKAVQNDTSFLEEIFIVDYSILVGFDEDTHEIVVGIIDYLRQYDLVKRMERVGKNLAMVADPTIIQPIQYRKRFTNAMEKYFMSVPDKFSDF